MADGDVIEYLIAHGAYVEAARIAASRGETARAIAFYERVWRFADALPLALALGDRGMAVRLALDANLPDKATEIAESAPRADLAAIADAFAARGRPFEAARAAERGGDFRRAASLFRRAGAPLEEGRARALAGDLREAGLVYERLVATSTGDEAGAAHLALGQFLHRLGRPEDAARHLQSAARVPALRLPALRALADPLMALGFRDAVAEIAARLRRGGAVAPRTLEALAAQPDDGEAGARAGERGEADAALASFQRFRIKRAIGSGAVGRVYEATDTLLGLPVAIKLLSVGGNLAAGPERQAYLGFAREAEAAGRLRHPNIVALHDAQPASGLFVFELLAGGTLADRLAGGGPLTPAAGRRLALDILAALAAAHEHGIVHRDVKPGNLLFDAAGNAKLGDFGGAHLADFGQTQTGGFLGTLAYMSPEQITGAAIGFSADLYALGATLYEALTGRPPFLGPDLVAQHIGETPPTPSSLNPDLSASHDHTLARALAKDPADRFASALEMAEAVAAWPTEAAAPADSTRAAPEVPIADPPSEPYDTRAGSERELWQTPQGRLLVRWDPRTARDVLVEERAQPVTDADLIHIRRLAAAGGPLVQRVLRLSDDRRAIWYETILGDARPLAEMTAAERARLAAPLAALPDGAARGFVRTTAGPVLLLMPTA
jgi:eukaryotic-like serine/threonine-protein kinase